MSQSETDYMNKSTAEENLLLTLFEFVSNSLSMLLPPSVWQTNGDPLRVAQRRADHPVMSSVYISVGRKRQELLDVLKAARVLVSFPCF